MALRVYRAPDATEDIIGQAAYLAKQNPSAAERYLKALEESFQLLLRSPELGAAHSPQVSRLPNLRVWRVKNFDRYLIYYHQVPAGIEIVRVLHSARDIQPFFPATDDRLTPEAARAIE